MDITTNWLSVEHCRYKHTKECLFWWEVGGKCLLKLDFPHGWGGELKTNSWILWHRSGGDLVSYIQELQVVLCYLLYSLRTTQSDTGMRKNLSWTLHVRRKSVIYTYKWVWRSSPSAPFSLRGTPPPSLPGLYLVLQRSSKGFDCHNGTIVTITFYTIIMIKVVVRKTWTTLKSIWFFASYLAFPLSSPFLTNVAKKVRIYNGWPGVRRASANGWSLMFLRHFDVRKQ